MTTDVAQPEGPNGDAFPPTIAGGLERLNALDAILGRELADVITGLEWAEQEIADAIARHPRRGDMLWRSFPLLSPALDRMRTEFVYRSHCRELLDRVVTGADIRPGTAVEVCCAMLEASLRTPLRSAAFGLYTRMCHVARFPESSSWTSCVSTTRPWRAP